MINRKAHAVWQGNGKEGKGTITTQSGVLSDQPYGFNTRFEDKPGTNPEELIAAAHSGCFTMAFAFQLQEAGLAATTMTTEAVVTLEKDGAGFKVTKSALTLRRRFPGSTRPSSMNSPMPPRSGVRSRRCSIARSL